MCRRARRSFSGSVLPEWVSSALPSKTRNPDHQSTCDTSIEHRGSRSRFLNFARVSVMETPTPPPRGYTVTMLSCGMPFRLNEVRTPCGLSWRNCSIWGGSCAGVGIGTLLGEGAVDSTARPAFYPAPPPPGLTVGAAPPQDAQKGPDARRGRTAGREAYLLGLAHARPDRRIRSPRLRLRFALRERSAAGANDADGPFSAPCGPAGADQQEDGAPPLVAGVGVL